LPALEFGKLLRDCGASEGLERVRSPRRIRGDLPDTDVIAAMAQTPRNAALHMPLQGRAR